MELITVALVAAPILLPLAIGAVYVGIARRSALIPESFAHERTAEQQLAA